MFIMFLTIYSIIAIGFFIAIVLHDYCTGRRLHFIKIAVLAFLWPGMMVDAVGNICIELCNILLLQQYNNLVRYLTTKYYRNVKLPKTQYTK